MEERRNSKRFDVAYHLEKREDEKSRLLQLIDLSKGGVSFTDRSEVMERQEVDMHIFLKEKRFDLKGLIVHAKKVKGDLYRFGVQFLEAPEDFITTLEKELDQIIHHHRESNLYRHRDLSFRRASEEFLKKDKEVHS